MSNFPNFKSGVGALTEETLNEWSRLLALVRSVQEDLPHIAELVAGAELSPRFPALLVGYQDSLGYNRYEYAWVEAIWSNSNAKLEVLDGGRTSYDNDFDSSDTSAGTPFNLPARNLIETGNDGFSIESSVDTEGAAYPDSWYLQPVRGTPTSPGGVSYEPETTQFWPVDTAPGVMMDLIRDDLGDVVPVFAVMNAHDGECA
jgi:hypothetical protein